MLQITPHMRILIAVDPVDFRKGIDGLSGLCRSVLEKDPFSGTIFVFRNKRKTSIKILVYDGQGFWVCQKRLSSGRFRWWPTGGTASLVEAYQLQLLLWNGDPSKAMASLPWRPLDIAI